jgi:conjugal transfer pilus assembly protein TraK
MNRLKRLFLAAPLLLIAFLSIGNAEQCGTENCSVPGNVPAEQKTLVVQSNYPKLTPTQGSLYPPVNKQSGKTPAIASPPPPITGRAENVTRQSLPKTPQADPAKGQILTGFDDAPVTRDEEGAFSGLPQRITPEGSSQVVLSSSDINRLICPVEIKDVIYSKEKGLTVRLAGNNAFVKFLVMKKDGKDLYATTPSELYMVCGENVYTMIAVPRRIPAQTVQLSGGKADSIRKNLTLFSEVPFEKRIIAIIKSIYTDRVPDSFTVRKMDKVYSVFQGLSLVLNTIVTIDGEGLTVKEYRARIAEGSKETTLTLREKDFLTADLAQKPVAVSIDTLNLKKGEISRIFIVERTEGGQP